MASERDMNLALFLDFDNVAIGARDARQRFDIHVVLERLLEKGKIVVKKAYADWSYYQDYMSDLHGAAIEMIEVPSSRISGKNSADIRMVVDAMDLCYSKDHIDAFVVISGDSDFSPLVSKLRENDKSVIGVGMKGSSSELLIRNCDEFIFYDDLVREPVAVEAVNMDAVPSDKKKLFNLLIATIEGLVREHKGPLYSSLVKDTMKRKKPDFNERTWRYSSFSDLLEEAMSLGLITVERDERAGGTLVVTALGGTPAVSSGTNGVRKPARRRGRRRGGRSEEGRNGSAVAGRPDASEPAAAAGPPPVSAPADNGAADGAGAPKPARSRSRRSRAAPTPEKTAAAPAAPAPTPATKPVKKTTARKPAKKAPGREAAKPAEARTRGAAKPAAGKDAPAKTTARRPARKAPARKAPTKD
ncbi:MAG: NYN domain-containing protein [bacterium]|nr:NYN domain-containing protein [bacterium]